MLKQFKAHTAHADRSKRERKQIRKVYRNELVKRTGLMLGPDGSGQYDTWKGRAKIFSIAISPLLMPIPQAFWKTRMSA